MMYFPTAWPASLFLSSCLIPIASTDARPPLVGLSMHYIASHCIALRRIASHWIALRRIASHSSHCRKVGFFNMCLTVAVLSGLNPLVVVAVVLAWKLWASSKFLPRGCRFNPEV